MTMAFSEDLDNGTSVALLDPSGAAVPGTTSTIIRPRLRRLIVGLPQATPGPYTVSWTSVSAEDGHVENSFFGLITEPASHWSCPIQWP